jgi:hypothetical protein
MLCYVMLCYVMLCYVLLCYAMLYYIMLCHIILWHITLHYVMVHHCIIYHIIPVISVISGALALINTWGCSVGCCAVRFKKHFTVASTAPNSTQTKNGKN